MNKYFLIISFLLLFMTGCSLFEQLNDKDNGNTDGNNTQEQPTYNFEPKNVQNYFCYADKGRSFLFIKWDKIEDPNFNSIEVKYNTNYGTKKLITIYNVTQWVTLNISNYPPPDNFIITAVNTNNVKSKEKRYTLNNTCVFSKTSYIASIDSSWDGTYSKSDNSSEKIVINSDYSFSKTKIFSYENQNTTYYPPSSDPLTNDYSHVYKTDEVKDYIYSLNLKTLDFNLFTMNNGVLNMYNGNTYYGTIEYSSYSKD